MRLTAELLNTVAGGSPDQSNVRSVVTGVNASLSFSGLDKPHRLAQFVAQVAHESGRFRYDREIWGPTLAQKRYEGRKDLGNIVRGDGSLFRGYGPIQLTGRDNVTRFEAWCNTLNLGPVPDFSSQPHLITTDPWEGLSAVWFWTVNKVNEYADKGDVEMVTRTVNGGKNGLDDRLELYVRCGLTMLGYRLEEGVVARFQAANALKVDDVAGGETRKGIHRLLVAMGGKEAVQVVDAEKKRQDILKEIRRTDIAPMPSTKSAAPATPVALPTAPVVSEKRQTAGEAFAAFWSAIFRRG